MLGISQTAITQAIDTSQVFFAFNESRLDSINKNHLDSLISSTAGAGNVAHVILKGHCDRFGSSRYNDSLSWRRCNAVAAYLIMKGISRQVIDSVTGFGENYPVINSGSKSEQWINRRVEIIIVKNVQAPKTDMALSIPAGEPSVYETLKEGMKDTKKTIVIRNLYFYASLDKFLPSSQTALNDLLLFLQHYPGISIEIHGHVCCNTDQEDAYELSVKRAKAVYNFLCKNGIGKHRLSFKGYGITNKIFPEEKSEMEKESNRRVEILILNPNKK
jgi:outer membrane protein OmpA-like peptidoglycan-associated protein